MVWQQFKEVAFSNIGQHLLLVVALCSRTVAASILVICLIANGPKLHQHYSKTLFASCSSSTTAKRANGPKLKSCAVRQLLQQFGHQHQQMTWNVFLCLATLDWEVLVTGGKSSGAEILTTIFAIILIGIGLNQASTILYSFEQGCIAAYRLYGVIRNSSSAANLDGNTLALVQGKI